MNHVANFLQAHLQKTGMRQRELAANMGIKASYLSKIVSGTSKAFTNESIAKMVCGIGPDPDLKAKMLWAIFLDQSPESTEDILEVIVQPKSKSGRVAEYQASNGPEYANLLKTLRESKASPRLIGYLTRIVEITGHNPDMVRVLAGLSKLP